MCASKRTFVFVNTAGLPSDRVALLVIGVGTNIHSTRSARIDTPSDSVGAAFSDSDFSRLGRQTDSVARKSLLTAGLLLSLRVGPIR